MKKVIFSLLVLSVLLAVAGYSSGEQSNKLFYYYLSFQPNSSARYLSDSSLISYDDGSITLFLSDSSGEVSVISLDFKANLKYSLTLKANNNIKVVSSYRDGDRELILASLATLCSCTNYGLLAKLEGNNVLWAKSFFLGLDVIPAKIIADGKGKYLVLSSAKIAGRGYDILLMYLDPDGKLLWYKIYGSDKDEIAEDMVASFGDEYLITAKTQAGMLLLDLNSDGSMKWSKLINLANIESSSISFNVKSEYVIVGYTDNLSFIMKIDRSGVLKGFEVFDVNAKIILQDITKSSGGGFIAVGSITILGSEKAFIVKLSENASAVSSYVLNKMNTRFIKVAQVLASNIFLGLDNDDIVAVKSNLDLSLPFRDELLAISYPMRSYAVDMNDYALDDYEQELTIFDGGLSIESNSLTINGEVLSIDPQVTTITARIGTTITVYNYYNATTITITSTELKTSTNTLLYSQTSTTLKDVFATVTRVNTSIRTTVGVDFTDPTVIAILLIAFLIGVGIAIAYRRL